MNKITKMFLFAVAAICFTICSALASGEAKQTTEQPSCQELADIYVGALASEHARFAMIAREQTEANQALPRQLALRSAQANLREAEALQISVARNAQALMNLVRNEGCAGVFNEGLPETIQQHNDAAYTAALEISQLAATAERNAELDARLQDFLDASRQKRNEIARRNLDIERSLSRFGVQRF